MLDLDTKVGLTFDDVILVPAASTILPKDTDISTLLARDIHLAIPFISAAMDTVTRAKMAIAMAQLGGIGIIHRNMTASEQAAEVLKVKKFESGMVSKPVTIGPEETIESAKELRNALNVSGFPVVEQGVLIGILTNRDLRSAGSNQKVKDVMTPKARLITLAKGATKDDALTIIHKNRIEKLPVVDEQFRLMGLITLRDIESQQTYPNATKDSLGRLCVGAAVGVGEAAIARAGELVSAGVDVIVVDTAHGHSSGVIETVKELRNIFSNLVLIAGNVATGDATEALIKAGADAVKVGVGPGSICTTRIVSGVGVPQITAVAECAKVARKKGVTIIADGGIKFSGDVVKAIAAGAGVVMMGSSLAGTEEAPGKVVIYHGRSYKTYRGMGSIGAMSGECRDRYSQQHVTDSDKLVPEGIEGRVPYRGEVSQTLFQFVGGLRSGMGYTGSKNIKDLQSESRFLQITSAGLKESHVHDVIITGEAPNYRVE